MKKGRDDINKEKRWRRKKKGNKGKKREITEQGRHEMKKPNVLGKSG